VQFLNRYCFSAKGQLEYENGDWTTHLCKRASGASGQQILPPLNPPYRAAYIDILALGVRGMIPCQLLDVGNPFVTFKVGS